MDMQKMQVRGELERMVYNFALLGKIENDTATEIVSFINSAIGGGDMSEHQGRIIDFPSLVEEAPLSEEKRLIAEWQGWLFNSDFREIKFCTDRTRNLTILQALYSLRIYSLEELARTPQKEIKKCKGIGEKSLENIQAALEKNGLRWTA